MKIKLVIICVIFVGLSCSPGDKNFNPFDNEFQFHQSFRIEDYDTIIGECGYWNLTNRNDGGYYQFFDDKPEIVAKGFYIYMDVVEVDTSADLIDDEFQRLLHTHPIDLSKLKMELSKLDVVDVKYVREFREVFDLKTGEEKMDSVHSLGLVYKNDSVYFPSIQPYILDNKVGWRVGYFNGRPY